MLPPIITPEPTPTSTSPPELIGPFEAPSLIVPVDKSNPTRVVDNHFIAQLSSTRSTLFNFNIPLGRVGKMCNVVFHLPVENHEWWQPFQLNAPGGISIAQLEQPATVTTTFSTIGNTRPVGSVTQLTQGQRHIISSEPCEAGKTVGYEVDAINGLDLQYFQMVEPASGLFITVSG